MKSTIQPEPLVQLEAFLELDPDNDGLRAEVFETAQRLGKQDRALVHVKEGMKRGAAPLAWQLRMGHWFMARHEWEKAIETLTPMLEGAQVPAELGAAVRQDLALIALRTGKPNHGLALIDPLLQALHANQGSPSPSLQVLWMRLTHHSGAPEAVVSQAQSWALSGVLADEAAGVASLAALDVENVNLCQAWSQAALKRHPQQLEALVCQGCLALGRKDPQSAARCLQLALQVNPEDGRAWSAWAFTELLAGNLPAARQSFEHSLQAMPGHIGTWHGLGWTALLQNDLPYAEKVFTHALEMDRNFSESHGGMAVVFARTGRHDESAAAIERALRLDRLCMSAHYAQALLEGTAGDVEYVQRLAARLMAARQQPKV